MHRFAVMRRVEMWKSGNVAAAAVAQTLNSTADQASGRIAQRRADTAAGCLSGRQRVPFAPSTVAAGKVDADQCRADASA